MTNQPISCWIAALTLAELLACGSARDTDTFLATGEAAANSAAELNMPLDESEQATPSPLSCPDAPGSLEQLSQTPRSDRHLELFALQLGGELTAKQEHFERLMKDRNAMGELRSEILDAPFEIALTYTTQMVLEGDLETFRQLQAGTHPESDAFDCANQRYGFVVSEPQPFTDNKYLAHLSTPKVLHAAKLVAFYEQFGGLHAWMNRQIPLYDIAGSSVTMEDDIWRYFFRINVLNTQENGNPHLCTRTLIFTSSTSEEHTFVSESEETCSIILQ